MSSYSMPLASLLDGYADAAGDQTVIRGMTLDSRAVEPGDAFVAMSGHAQHGLRYLDQAVTAGCAAVLYERSGTPAETLSLALRKHASLPAYPVASLAANLGALADRFFRAPSADMMVIGVTGTNGKSSFVHLLGHGMNASGQSCGTLGTLGYGLSGNTVKAPLTTPDAITVQRELASIRDHNGAAAVMEVSSHALEQGRVNNVRFAGAVFTNLSRDHLDYHGDMTAYGQAKAALFQWPGLRFAIINSDDQFGQTLIADLADDVMLIDYGLRSGQVRAAEVQTTAAGLSFRLITPWGDTTISSSLVGRFNVLNLLAVAATLGALETPLPKIKQLLEQATPVPGRMQVLGGGEQPLLVVDYAHTPDALEQALSALREHCTGRLICVFGCGGDRDVGKRPLMGEIAERLADGVVITDDNPRSENGDAIVSQILAGMTDSTLALVERNRTFAIQAAISTADADDIVLVAGKGHEDYQEVDGVRLAFDDCQVIAETLSGVGQ